MCNTVKSRFNVSTLSFLKLRFYSKSRLFDVKFHFGHKISFLKSRLYVKSRFVKSRFVKSTLYSVYCINRGCLLSFNNVSVPPRAPDLLSRNATTTAVELIWMSGRSRKQPVLGYTLHYRPEHGPWRTLDSDPLTDALWLDGLSCGTNHSIYITAYNHVGESHPSPVAATSTTGRVPDIPLMNDLLKVNRTALTLSLDSFSDGGCPILYFVVEYRRAENQHHYQLVANNVSPKEKSFPILGLDPATRYFVKVTAHNTAGSSVAEYPFSTLTPRGATVPPPNGTKREKSTSDSNSESSSDNSSSTSTSTFFYAFKIVSILFLSCSILVAAFYVAVFARKWKRKRECFDMSMDRRPFRIHSSPALEPSSRFSTVSNGTLQRRPHSKQQQQQQQQQQSQDDQSPMLPPNTFRATPIVSAAVAANCPVAAVTAAGSNMYLQPQQQQQQQQPLSPTPEPCPYASFPPGEPQQVTLKLHPIEATFCPIAIDGPSFQTLPGRTAAAAAAAEPLYATLLGRHRDFPSREELAGRDGKRLVSLHVADTKYDSDSDFDYRQPRHRRPPPGRGRRGHHHHHFRRHPASQSSTSSDEEDNLSVSPLPRVRSIEALEGVKLSAAARRDFWRRNLQYDPPAPHIMFGSSLVLPNNNNPSPKSNNNHNKSGSLKRVRQIHV